ncbi:nitrate reductase [Rhizobium paknamense]|uniref:Assimilatory nitrate reductase catalytic subunit n=1 Tax=Rhizobium paknamense TaxID=1206817 RepID=A0ABU0II11_9HYPH|nr:nitrate reductase [Rhizobium paknamense]MDQ0457872.1 assimilatory nitrate reductase catalytic subunit [Rhizobium paknamense]
MTHEVKTTCPYCGVGCGVIARVTDAGDVSVSGDPDHPANFGRLCSKGSALAETLGLEGRALDPIVQGKTTTWDEALDLVAGRFQETIAEYGPDSVAFYLSGQLLTEDYYVANKLMKGFIGSANIDTNSRLCMASSVAGHRRAFGSDTVPGTYEDLELADLVVLVGSNMGWCHPVLYQRLAAAKAKRPGMKVVVIDPRRTATSDLADLHLSIAPDGDVALFNELLLSLMEQRKLDEGYILGNTEGFEEAVAAARRMGLAHAAATGLSHEERQAFFRLFGQTEKVVTCYSQGVNQSSIGTDKVNAIINCHLATGRIGRPGMGPFSLTGQPNAMGGREVGGLANMLAAHMVIENPTHRERVKRFWNAPAMAEKPGLKAVDMFEAVADGRIKALWIMSTNPVVSMPDADRVKAAIEACPFVVVSDMQADTDTARLAHVLLPASGWGEKSGTVTNSERRISRQRPFLTPPGTARPDWWHMAQVAQRMGFSGFDYTSPAEIFAEHAALSGFENDGERDFDISAHAGIDQADYEALSPFQWPQRHGQSRTTTRFFAKGSFYHADRKARFIALETAPPCRTDKAFPLVLNTGRVRDHWHTMTRTGKSARLSAHLAEPFVEIHPRDAAGLGIAEADLVQVESAHGGAVIVRALLTDRQKPGRLFIPMHWTGETAARARIDSLVPAVTDALSGQPALKHVPVKARRYQAAAYGFAIRAFPGKVGTGFPSGNAQEQRARAFPCFRETLKRSSASKPDLKGLSYWALAKADGGYRAELAFDAAVDWEDWAREAFALGKNAEMIGYHDAASGDARLAFFEENRLVAAVFVSRQPVAVSRDWASEQLAQDFSDRRARLSVIAGRPGAGAVDRGAIVCACFSVGVNQITDCLRKGCTTVEDVGRQLSAGTNCGSCRTEIRRLIDKTYASSSETASTSLPESVSA